MKKSILLILFSGLMVCFSLNSFSQMYGRWVLGTCATNNSEHETLLLTFNTDGYEIDTLAKAAEDHHLEVVLGAYNVDYSLLFYFLDTSLCYQNQSYDWTNYSDAFRGDYEIVNKPGTLDSNFYFVYCPKDAGKSNDLHCLASEISMDNSTPVITTNFDLVIETKDTSFIGFAIAQEEYGERNLYLASMEYYDQSQYVLAGLRRWIISSTGIDNMTVLLNAGGSITVEDFSAYTLEVCEVNGEDIIAWITTNPASIDKVFIYDEDNNDEYVHDLNLGRIGGIKFSGLNDSILYVSCRDTGIVALNYFTGNIEEIVYSDTNMNYRTTSLQTAPDGNIYGVSYNGRNLGRINMPEGDFSHEVLEIADLDYNLSTYRTFDSEKYYRLPENSRQFDYLDVALIDKTDVCPGDTTGWAEIGATGGFPEYTYTLYKLIDGDTVLVETVTTEDESYIFQNLSMGYYLCIVSDTHGNEVSVSFFIEEDDDAFDVKVMDTISQFEPEYWTNVQRSYYRGFEIMPGVSVSITDSSILQFGRDARVIIHPGAELIVQNSALTHFIECDTMWRGIEVRGDSEEHQYTLNDTCRQGKLQLNNALISNAYTAVALYGTHYDSARAEWRTHWNESGGIVQAVSSRFINNRKSIHFVPYRNYLPNNPAQEMDNLSYIDLCLFEVNQDYIPNHIFYKHVDLHDVKGISFEGCTFTNSGTEGISNYCQGIASYTSDFKASFYCTQAVSPCPDSIRGSFSGFYRAIGAYGSVSSYKTFQVIGNNFQNNHTGVFVAGVNDNVIVDNHFEIGLSSYDMDDCEGTPNGFGVDMQEAFGFAIEDNYFTKYNLAVSGVYAGIRAKDCPSPNDIIYRNHFVGLYFGNYAQGNNRSESSDITGLEYRCNTNIDNLYDFIVTDPIDLEEAKIRDHIGNYDTAAGNTFSQDTSTVWHIKNDGKEVISYYYNQYYTLQVPEVEKVTYYFVELIDDAEANLCPDHYAGGGDIKLTQDERIQKESVYNQNLIDFNVVNSQYETLKDGGDTEAELNDVQAAQPDDMWDLRAQLLGDSPHLSQEVLMESSDRTDVFPDDVLFDILAANPDELKEDTLMSYLENKEDPLPDYMISMLRDLAIGNITYKTILKNQLADHYSRKTQAAQDIVRSILNDSMISVTDYRNWLDNMACLEADKQIIASYLSENDTASAMTLMNMIPDLYGLEGDDLDDFNDYKDLVLMQQNWKQNGKNILELDSMDIANLEVYANGSSGSARAMARSMLSYAYNYNFCDCLVENDSSYYKSSQGSNWNSLNNTYGPMVKVEPNPADTWLAFNYELSSKESVGYLKISSINGEEIQQFVLHGKKGQQIWDTRTVNPGVYLYTLMSNGLISTGKIVIK